MFHYLYKITNKVNGKFYIGKHSSGKKFCEFCKETVITQFFVQHHGKYCSSNPNRIEKKKKNKYVTKEYICPHCGHKGKQPKVMEMNHFENCPHKKEQ